jgi:hypothetical protein
VLGLGAVGARLAVQLDREAREDGQVTTVPGCVG